MLLKVASATICKKTSIINLHLLNKKKIMAQLLILKMKCKEKQYPNSDLEWGSGTEEWQK